VETPTRSPQVRHYAASIVLSHWKTRRPITFFPHSWYRQAPSSVQRDLSVCRPVTSATGDEDRLRSLLVLALDQPPKAFKGLAQSVRRSMDLSREK
jgi:hypothetical protein